MEEEGAGGMHYIMSHVFQAIFIQILILFLDTKCAYAHQEEVLFDYLENSAQKLVNRLSL